MKKTKVASAASGAAGMAAIPVGMGVYDWRVLAGAAAAGAVAGWFGVDLAKHIKTKLPAKTRR
ncbi:MAG TPA: hypothetical protein DCZ63_08445 [Geobacter sp.]|nr:hypothetical protein [Geobacter sp.]